MPNTVIATESATAQAKRTCKVAVIWIDWYAYHLGRFRGLLETDELAGRVAGIEIVGGIGVHRGLKFRETIPDSFAVRTLFPGSSWQEVKGRRSGVAVWKALTEIDPATVLVPGYYTAAGLSAALWGKWHGRRTVLMTESTEHDHARSGWKEVLKRKLLRALFDWAIAGGGAHRRYLERLHFPKDRIARFYDVVDNDYFNQQSGAIRKNCKPADFDLPENYFLSVGRLAPEKNIGGLLAAYFEYRRAGGKWSLVIVGDGPLRKELEAKAAASIYGRDVHFTGLKGTADLPQYYAFASCFVLPSTREPWGLVANEAMASGLPVIISNRCGCAEDLVVEGQNGLLFDVAQPDSLTASLRVIGDLSKPRLVAMGRQSLEIVSRFSPRAWGQEVARISRQ